MKIKKANKVPFITSLEDDFLSGKNKKQKKLFNEVIDAGFDFYSGKQRDQKFLVYRTPDELKEVFAEAMPEDSTDLPSIINYLRLIGHYSISQSDLSYLAFPDSGNSIAALLGDIYGKFLNQNLIAFDRSAPAATIIEIQLIEWLRALIGYESKELKQIENLAEVSGMCTTGGHMSNHVATLSALNCKYPQIKKDGLSSLDHSPKIVLSGKIGHYSYGAAMHHLGLGNANIINTDSNDDFTTNIDALENVLEQHKDKNDIFMVVAVAGNCRTTGIDNIASIAKICKKYGIWLHVDACHGGSLLFSDKLKKRYLMGIEEADSVALDPHKGLFVAYPCSFVLFKKRDTLVTFTRYEKEARNGESWDLGYITPFLGSRGFESLKLMLLIKHLGKKRLSEITEKRQGDALYVESLIAKSGYFVLFNDMTFYRMAFVYYPNKIRKQVSKFTLSDETNQKIINCIDHYTHTINSELYKEGDICLDEFKLHDIGNQTATNAKETRFYVMSITTGNPLLTNENLKRSLSFLFKKAKRYESAMGKDIVSIIKSDTYAPKVTKTYGPAGWN